MRASATVVALVLLLGATAAQAAVRKVSLTSPVQAGDTAVLTVNVSPKARCSIKVTYSGLVARTGGLTPRVGGRITWRWRIAASTKPGRWPIVVTCGKSGMLRTNLRVLPAEPLMALNDAAIAVCE